MIALFIAIAFSVRENERRICVCNDACPKVCDVFEKILIYYTPDLDAEFTKLKTKYMDVRFCHAPSPFTFNIGTFDGCEVQFDSFHLAPKAQIKVMVTRASTAEPSFNNLVVTFAGHSPSQEFDIKAIKFNEVDSHNDNIAPRLITQSFEASNSIYDFTDVTIKKECSDPALAIDVLRGYNLELTIGKNIVTYGSSTFHFEGKSTATISTQLKDVKLTVNGIAQEDMPYLILVGFPYTTFKGIYPSDYIIQMQNLEENTVIAEETRLPISLDGARVNVYVSQPETTIEGDSSCDVSLYTKAQPAQRYKVTIVKLNGKIDIYSSWLDVHLNVFNPGLQVWEAPWSFCVGKGGVSTLFIANTLYTGTSPVSAFKYHCDFKIYLDDDQLKNLLKSTHTILTVDTNKTVFTADSVSIIPVDNLDVPGFASSSNCVSIEIAKAYPFQIDLKAVSPTTLPLKLCYADEISQCQVDSDGFFINSYLISNLSTCIHPGFNNVVLTLKKDLTSLNFGSLIKTQKDLEIEIKSKLSKNPSLGNIVGAKKEIVKSIKFTNIDIGGGEIECDSVTFTGCGRVQDKTISFVTTALVDADDASLSIFKDGGIDLRNLYLRLDHYDTISSKGKELIFSDSQLDHKEASLDATDLTSLSIHAIDTLYLNPNGLEKEFTIDHDFTEKMSSNRLVLNNTLPQSVHITYDHSTYDVEIVRGTNKDLSSLNIKGSGEVSFINDYTESTRFCVTNDENKCTRYKYDPDHIIKNSDQGDKIRLAPQKKVYVDVYTSYTVTLMALFQKVVEFQNLESNSVTLTIKCEGPADSSPETTTTKITGFHVEINDYNNYKLGHFEMRNCTFQVSGFQGKEIKAVDFIGPYTALSGATSISVDGYCEFYGPITISKTFNIAQNTNRRRFRACIPHGSTVTVTDDKIKINELEFTIGHNDEGLFDADLYTDTNITFDLVYGGGDMAKFPKIQFSKLISTTVNFNGAWPSETNPNNFKLVFSHTQYLFNLNINTGNVPAQFDNVQSNFNIVSTQESTKICGLFNVVSEAYHEMTVSGPDGGQINFAGGIGVAYKSWIKILKPITVTVSEVSLTDPSRIEGTISFQNYIRAGANSRVVITNKLNKLQFNPVFELYGDFHQSLDSEEIKRFLDTTVDLCTINSEDIAKFKSEVKSVGFVDPLPTTHGFVGSNFEVYIPEDRQEALVYLRKKSDPIKTPARACYGTSLTSDCELIITDENMSSFASFLPNSIETIGFTFGKDSETPLNLNNEKFNNIKLSIKSSTNKPVKVKLTTGSGNIDHLDAENVDFEFNLQSNDEHPIKSAKFINSVANTYAGFGEIEYDFESWKRKEVTEFPGRFLLVYPENDFTFKEDRWVLQDHNKEYEILAEKFPNFAINFTTSSYVYLKADRDITSVADCDVYIQSTDIEVGENWNYITSPQELNVVTSKPLNEIVVTCQSYPFTVLPISNGTTIKFGRETLPITTKDKISLNNQKFTIDFSLVEDKEESRLYVDNGIELSGNSMIYFPNSKSTSFPCIAKEVVAKDGSDSSATDIFVTNRVALYGNARLSSSINFSEATVEFHWWGDHMPYLNNQVEIFPRGVTVFFDGSVSEAGYIKDKSYPLVEVGPNCNNWLKNVKYQSKEKQFRGKKSRSTLTCQDGVLTISGNNNICTLSVGAICGIVIGCVAFVAIVVFLVIFFIRRRRNNAGGANSGGLLTSSLTSQ